MRMSDKRLFKARLAGISSVSFVLALILMVSAAGMVFGQEKAPEGAAQRAPGAQAASEAQGAPADSVSAARADVQKWGLIAAAAAFGLGALAAGLAISNVGSAAMGAIGEKPEVAGQALIFVALAEGLVVFGFITALMILGKV